MKPDVPADASDAINNASFIAVKESFDRIIEMDKESNEELFLSAEYMRARKQE